MTTADCSTGRQRSDAMRRIITAASVLALCLALQPHAAGAQTVEGWLNIAAIGIADMPIVLMPIVRGEWAEDYIGENEAGLLDGIGRHPYDVYGMVIAGHVTLDGGRTGPFYWLSRLRRGDELSLTMAGRVFIYRVEKLERIRPTEVRSVYVRNGRTLTLLTCTEWDARSGSYARRLAVRANLIHSHPITGVAGVKLTDTDRVAPVAVQVRRVQQR